MSNKLIKFKTAVLAKEKGYDVPVNNYYDEISGLDNGDGDCEFICLNHNKYEKLHSAPTLWELHEWLRDKHSIRVFPTQKVSGDYGFEIYVPNEENPIGMPFKRISPFTWHYDTYDAALDAGLREGLKQIK